MLEESIIFSHKLLRDYLMQI